MDDVQGSIAGLAELVKERVLGPGLDSMRTTLIDSEADPFKAHPSSTTLGDLQHLRHPGDGVTVQGLAVELHCHRGR